METVKVCLTGSVASTGVTAIAAQRGVRVMGRHDKPAVDDMYVNVSANALILLWANWKGLVVDIILGVTFRCIFWVQLWRKDCVWDFFSQEMFQKKDPQSAWNWWREFCPIAKFSSFMSCGGIFRYTLQRMLFFLKKSFLISKYNFLSPPFTSKPSYMHLFTNFKIHGLFFFT